jgi:hypothetical protein
MELAFSISIVLMHRPFLLYLDEGERDRTSSKVLESSLALDLLANSYSLSR